jgi:hypothetical protein
VWASEETAGRHHGRKGSTGGEDLRVGSQFWAGIATSGEGGHTDKFNKKEEFPDLMEHMLPGNSFPQICVVSVKHSVENYRIQQDDVRTMAVSNQIYLLKSTIVPLT